LTILDYCVAERNLGPVRGVNLKGLPDGLVSRGKAMLREVKTSHAGALP
jgi:hypothetical protein